jgi:type IV secretory pathway VirJ component
MAAQGLPLVEVPSTRDGPLLAFLISGDGNWAGADKDMAAELAARGISVVGLKARDYLKSRHATPEGTTADAAQVLRTYLERWNRSGIVLVGYSRGADLMPFVARGLPEDLRDRVRLVALLGPADHASFQFHAIDLLKDVHRATDLPVLPEVEGLGWTKVLCVYGDDEKNSLCRLDLPDFVQVVARDGGHRIKDGGPVVDAIVEALGVASR